MHIKEVFNAMYQNHHYEYIVINKMMEVIEFSDCIVDYCDEKFMMNSKINIFSLVPELYGLEEEIDKVMNNQRQIIEIPFVEKGDNKFVNLSVHQGRKNKENTFDTLIVLFENVTEYVLMQRVSLQDRNDKELLLYELEKKYKELESAKKEAIIANETKSIFLANMSHEIRTPLNAMTGFINIISNEFSDKKLLLYVDVIKRNSESLLDIINDILDFNKIESGKLDIVKEYFDLYKEMNDITELFSAKADEKDIKILLNIADDVPMICESDQLRLKQIISNILSNAIKFTNESGLIKFNISIDSLKEKLLFSIEDNGIGISEKYKNNIFKAFTQEDESITKIYGGTGLGLNISYKLVRLLDSQLKVRSQLGKGSEFYFSLPLVYVDNIDKKLKEIIPQMDIYKDFTDKHILLVEDNKSNQMFMKIILNSMKLDVEIAQNGAKAVEMFKKKKYDLILMDENMPILNGIEATKQIVEIEKEKNLKHTPIVALTANALKGDRDRFLAAGMDEYLTKPLDNKKLLETLQLLL